MVSSLAHEHSATPEGAAAHALLLALDPIGNARRLRRSLSLELSPDARFLDVAGPFDPLLTAQEQAKSRAGCQGEFYSTVAAQIADENAIDLEEARITQITREFRLYSMITRTHEGAKRVYGCSMIVPRQRPSEGCRCKLVLRLPGESRAARAGRSAAWIDLLSESPQGERGLDS